MSITSINYDDHLHRIRIKLYPAYLPNTKGMYLARTANEGSLSIEDVCNQMKTRGGFDGDYKTLVDNIKAYFRECAYDLADGWAINTGYFTVFPNIGGTFLSGNEPYNAEKHPVSFRFRANAELRKLIREISVIVEGVSNAKAFIYEFADLEANVTNDCFTAGHLFGLSGSKIKIDGDDPSCGLYFVPLLNPQAAVKVTRIADNTPSRIIGVAPLATYQDYRIEVRTQFTGTRTTPLKEPRIIVSDFTIVSV